MLNRLRRFLIRIDPFLRRPTVIEIPSTARVAFSASPDRTEGKVE